MVSQHKLVLEDQDRSLREAWDLLHSQTHDRNRYCATLSCSAAAAGQAALTVFHSIPYLQQAQLPRAA